MHDHSGIGTYIRNVLSGIKERDDVWREILVLRNKNTMLEYYNTLVCNYKIYTIAEQACLPVIARKAKIFHAPHYNAPLLFPGKLVVTIHDLNHIKLLRELPTLLHKVYAVTIMTFVVKRADVIITVSEWTRRQICRLWPSSEEKIKTIYNGIKEPCDIINGREILKRHYKIEKPYILYLGLLKKHKNLSRLINAFSLAQDLLREQYLLIIAGDIKSDDVNLLEKISRNQYKDLIRLIDYVPRSRLPALYFNASLFVFPSLAEGFGLPPLEAMSYGVPVISSNATCLPEVLKDAPMYFDPLNIHDMSNCIKRALSDEKWRKSARVRGKKISLIYSWDKAVDQYIDIYYALLKKI